MSEQSNPYRFTVSVWHNEYVNNGWWVIVRGDDGIDLWDAAGPLDTEAEARSHAALVLAALHTATMEGEQ